MSSKPRASVARAVAARAEAERRRRTRVAAGASAVVVLAVLVLVVAKFASGSGSSGDAPAKATGALDSAVMRHLLSVDPTSIAAAGNTEPSNGPHAIEAPAVTRDGKPYVLYVGAEYCPFCAAERWALTLALSQFGSFDGLRTGYSGAEDVFPDTATVSYYGSRFTSEHLAFRGVELRTSELVDGQYTPLENLTGEDATLFNTYNAPPFVNGQGGSIPWVNLGGTAVHSGASFTPELMQGKTQLEIAQAIADPQSTLGRQVRSATANYVRVLCGLTGGKPAAVCGPFEPSAS